MDIEGRRIMIRGHLKFANIPNVQEKKAEFEQKLIQILQE